MDACTNPEILKVILYVTMILKVVFIIVPIGLILMISVDLFKNVIATKEENMKKNVSVAVKRIILCVCLFFVPTIVSLMNTLLGNLSVPYTDCLENANMEYIEGRIVELASSALETARTEQTMSAVLEAQTAIEKVTDESQKNQMEEELNTIKETVIANQQQLQEQEEEQNSSSNNSSSSDDENLEDGTQKDYFAPIQNVSGYSFGKVSSTAGCTNQVSHDLSGPSLGTPIYAGMDGTAYFEQWITTQNGKTVLASYGNVVTIKAADGTYIIYAHLQKFASYVNAPVTQTCNYPCSATNYSITKRNVKTVAVEKGDLIGYLGSTGNSSGAHLHVEIHEQGSGRCIEDPWAAFGMK